MTDADRLAMQTRLEEALDRLIQLYTFLPNPRLCNRLNPVPYLFTDEGMTDA